MSNHSTNPTSPPTTYHLPSTKSGFTLIEMLIIAPIVILVIGVFVSAIISMTGEVLSVRGKNALVYNIQDALNRIDQDVKSSGGYLAINNIALTSPQGYDDNTAVFKNADATNGTMLILNTYATTANPLSSTRNYVYATGQPNACNDSLVSQNQKIKINIVYFVKNNALWRRVIAPSNYATVGCSVPWQQPTCAPGYNPATYPFCKTQDIKLVDGVSASGFVINYYTSAAPTTMIANAVNSGLSEADRQTALQTASTVDVKISATGTLAGRDVSQSGTIRSISIVGEAQRTSCIAILNAGESTGDGIYWIYPTGSSGFQVYCDMTNQGGGWTLAINLQTSDGTIRHYNDTDFWTGTAQYGSLNTPFANDYKSTSFSQSPATEIMMLANNLGTLMGTAKYTLIGSASGKTLNWMFNNLSNTTITGNRTGNSGSVGSNGRARNDGDGFIDHTYPVIINSTYQPLDATNQTRLGTNYSASCGVIDCNGHNYGGWGGIHTRAGWGAYYEGAAINGYCSTQGGFGTNGSLYTTNNAFDGCSPALHTVDMAVYIR